MQIVRNTFTDPYSGPSAGTQGAADLGDTISSIVGAAKQARMMKMGIARQQQEDFINNQYKLAQTQDLANKNVDYGAVDPSLKGMNGPADKVLDFLAKKRGYTNPNSMGVDLSTLYPDMPAGYKVPAKDYAQMRSKEGGEFRATTDKTQNALNSANELGNTVNQFLADPKAKDLFPANQAESENMLSPAAWGAGALKAEAPGYGATKTLLDQLKAKAVILGKEDFGAIGRMTESEMPVMQSDILSLNYKTPWPQVVDTLTRFNNLKARMAQEAQSQQTMGFVKPVAGLARRQQGMASSQGAAPATPPQQAPARGPQIGEIDGGYRFKGGNPSDPNSWQQVR